MKRIFSVAAALAATTLVCATASAQTIGCELGGTGGPFPTAGTGDGTFQTVLPSAPATYTLNVPSIPGGATVVTEVRLNGLSHTFISDTHFVLTAPSGVKHNVLCRPAGSCDFTGGNYVIVPQCSGGLAWPATCTTTIAPGTYDQFFGVWTNGNHGINNTPLDSIAAATGVWTLTAYDWVGADVGALTTWDLCFGTPTVPAAPTAAPVLNTPANGASVFGPNVTLTWATVACATSYDVDVDSVITNVPANSYVYTSTPGGHTWTVRGVNASGVGPWAASRTFTDLGPAPTPCSGSSLTTLFASNNSGSIGGQVFVDLNVLDPTGITVAQLDTNTTLTIGSAFSLQIYTKSGTFVGFETTSGAWTLAASGSGISAGVNQPSLVEFTDFALPQGVTGMALIMVGGAHAYTGTSAIPPTTFYSNADLTITGGKALNVPWSGTPFSPRMWNGTVRYDCAPAGPVSYCTAGTTTNGCLASVGANANPSVSLANACNITVTNVEGQKSGIVFYGLASNNLPWGSGSPSFLCVKTPTQRTGTQGSGGTVNLCDGTLVLDWNAFQSANPTAVGQPWSAGDKAYVQAWFRDPPAPKTTNLSDGLEMTYVP